MDCSEKNEMTKEIRVKLLDPEGAANLRAGKMRRSLSLRARGWISVMVLKSEGKTRGREQRPRKPVESRLNRQRWKL